MGNTPGKLEPEVGGRLSSFPGNLIIQPYGQTHTHPQISVVRCPFKECECVCLCRLCLACARLRAALVVAALMWCCACTNANNGIAGPGVWGFPRVRGGAQ